MCKAAERAIRDHRASQARLAHTTTTTTTTTTTSTSTRTVKRSRKRRRRRKKDATPTPPPPDPPVLSMEHVRQALASTPSTVDVEMVKRVREWAASKARK